MIDNAVNQKNNIPKLLKSELLRIQKTSPKFSMRSFAKKLKISQTELSEVLSGKRSPSSRLILNFFKHCSKTQAEYLEQIDLLQRSGLKLKKKDRHLFQLEGHQFKTISEWQHFALLSLIETHDFLSDTEWIAKRLGITKPKAEDCIRTLRHLGLIRVDQNGKITLTNEGLKTSDEVECAAIKESHSRDLEIVKNVIHSPMDLTKRDLTSCTYAVNTKKIKKFKALVRKFQDQVAELVEDDNADEVYRMSVYFYPLTITKTEEKS